MWHSDWTRRAPGDERGTTRLGDLSLLLPQAIYEDGVVEYEIEHIPEELQPQFDRAGPPIEPGIGRDRLPDPSGPRLPIQWAIPEGPDRARLVQDADAEMKEFISRLLLNGDSATRKLINRLFREVHADAKKVLVRLLDARHQLTEPWFPLALPERGDSPT